jgi:hypothetical protein
MTIINSNNWVKELGRCYEDSRYLRYKNFCEGFNKKILDKNEFKIWFYKASAQTNISKEEWALISYITQV